MFPRTRSFRASTRAAMSGPNSSGRPEVLRDAIPSPGEGIAFAGAPLHRCSSAPGCAHGGLGCGSVTERLPTVVMAVLGTRLSGIEREVAFILASCAGLARTSTSSPLTDDVIPQFAERRAARG